MALQNYFKEIIVVFAVLMTVYIIIQKKKESTQENIFQQPEIMKLKLSLPKNKSEYFNYLKIPKLKDQTNKARIGHGACLPKKKSGYSDKLEMTVVTNYIPVDLLRHKRSIYGKRTATHEEEEARISEIISCYQANLNHIYVKTLYILVQYYPSMVYLRTLNLENSEKLVIQWVNQTITVEYTLKYISKCLQGHIVAMVHQDNIIGAGFDKVDPQTLIDNKLMYALTRQTPYRSYCFYGCMKATCDARAYQGSHDAFIFHVKVLPEEAMRYITTTKIESNEKGMENVFIWMFRTKLGYKVINPCLVLHIHHEHCVPIRQTTIRTVHKKVSAVAKVTDKLT